MHYIFNICLIKLNIEKKKLRIKKKGCTSVADCTNPPLVNDTFLSSDRTAQLSGSAAQQKENREQILAHQSGFDQSWVSHLNYTLSFVPIKILNVLKDWKHNKKKFVLNYFYCFIRQPCDSDYSGKTWPQKMSH